VRKAFLLDVLTLALGLGLFFALSLYQITLPGLYYDEAADAVPAVQLIRGQEVELFKEAGISLGNRDFPITTMDYVGVVNTYALLPFFGLLGINVFSLRLMTVLAGGLTLVLGYLLGRALFGRGVAVPTVLLLAVHPSFIFWTRQGIYVTSVMGVMAMGSLLSLLWWKRSGQSRYLYLGAFLLGLGLSAKFLFLWQVLALAVIYAALSWGPRLLRRSAGVALVAPQARSYQRQGAANVGRPGPFPPPWRQREMAAALPFLLGAGTLILYNVQTRGTLDTLAKNLVTTSNGVNNLAFFQNVVTELDAFRVLLNGGSFWFLGGLFTNQFYPAVFAISLAALGVVLLARREARIYGGRVLFLAGFIALMVVQSSFTVSRLDPAHLYILMPLPQMTIVLAGYLLARYAPWRRAALALGVAVFMLLFGSDLWVDFQYHRALSTSGGWFSHSDAIYGLADYLEERGAAKPMAMDWGIKANVQVLAQGKVNPLEIFQYSPEPAPSFVDWLYGAMQNPDNLYLFHSPDYTMFQRFRQFEELATKLNRKITVEMAFTQRDGTPVYLVYSVR